MDVVMGVNSFCLIQLRGMNGLIVKQSDLYSTSLYQRHLSLYLHSSGLTFSLCGLYLTQKMMSEWVC